MTMLAPDHIVETCDVTALGDADRTLLARLHQALSKERIPEDPPTPLDIIEQRLRHRPTVVEEQDWIVRVGGEIVASASLARYPRESNPHWRETTIEVHPEHRRCGIANGLIRHILDASGDDAEIVYAYDTNDRIPAAGAFAGKLGGKPALHTRTSSTTLAAIDRALVREWSATDPAGYRLVWIDDDVPDELVPNVIVAYDTMNTAPRGDLSFGDWRTTAEEIRDWERIRMANARVSRLLLAIHSVTGETAGFTQVERHPRLPWVVHQHGTAVVPAHRGHGIGKWIKAAMIERILREWPDARFIRTGNAWENAPMLSINDRLGFTVSWSKMVWQIGRAELTTYAEARGL